MTETKKFELLKDLALLVRKHGPAAFSDLAYFLRDSQAVEELATILETAESVGRKRHVFRPTPRSIKRRTPRQSLRELLSDLRAVEPEKADLLLALSESLSAKRALPTLRELRSFTRDNGLNAVTGTSREKVIPMLVRDLATRSADDLRRIIGSISVEDSTNDRSLDRWTDVILSNRRSRHG